MKTPWHVWVLGLIFLIWFGLGAFDYAMSHLRPQAYLAMMPADLRADMTTYLDGYPVWATSAWAIGVWFAVLGAVLLLARSRFCVPAFMLSTAGFAANCAYTYLIGPQIPALTGSGSMMLSGAIFLSLILAIVYTRRLNFVGVFG